jgi:hypothetical protein
MLLVWSALSDRWQRVPRCLIGVPTRPLGLAEQTGTPWRLKTAPKLPAPSKLGLLLKDRSSQFCSLRCEFVKRPASTWQARGLHIVVCAVICVRCALRSYVVLSVQIRRTTYSVLWKQHCTQLQLHCNGKVKLLLVLVFRVNVDPVQI